MRERPKFDGRTLKRLLSYMRAYKGTLVLVTVCILLSAVAGAASSMFLQKLIDGYIVPMLAGFFRSDPRADYHRLRISCRYAGHMAV